MFSMQKEMVPAAEDMETMDEGMDSMHEEMASSDEEISMAKWKPRLSLQGKASTDDWMGLLQMMGPGELNKAVTRGHYTNWVCDHACK
jgi:hypothetical protein